MGALRVRGEVRSDWAVIGAGMIELAAARRLAELWPDDSVAVIEAVRVGHGTSGRNAAFLAGRKDVQSVAMGHGAPYPHVVIGD